MKRSEAIVRLAGLVVFAAGGWWIGENVLSATQLINLPSMRYVLGLLGAVVGFAIFPLLTVQPVSWARQEIREFSTQSLMAATIGAATGLFIGVLLAFPLHYLPGALGDALPLVIALVLAYLGATTTVSRQKEVMGFLGHQVLSLGEGSGSGNEHYVLLDTSVIIDGRIADISETGFIQGTMMVPRFVLDELQHIADSADSLRRNRGRRGLEMLNRLQKDSDVPVKITEMDVPEIEEVDGKLVKLAKELECAILTNDYNLNRVADLQGVQVLNINKLANAVKAVVLPGESIKVRIIQKGKEEGQGVGYLDDGTMVVIEDGRKYIDSTREVTVTRVLQTVAGRMIFAQPNGSN